MSSRVAQCSLADLRPVSPLVGWGMGMGTSGLKVWVRGFWKRPRYALPSMLLVRVDLDVNNLLVVRSRYGDCGR